MSSRLTEPFLRDTLPHRSLDQLSRLPAEACLQWLEMLLRYGSASADETQQALEQVYKRFPQWADTHYLYALGMQSQGPQALIALLERALATPLKGFTGHLWRLCAEQHAQLHQWDQATRALRQAFAQMGEQPAFVHCTQGDPSHTCSAQALAFDFSVFDALCPWTMTACVVKFQALTVSPQGEVWVLEANHGWLFCFDARGKFRYGLREHDLADQRFLHPEYLFDLRDIAASAEYLYVAGAQHQVHVLTHEGQPVRTLTPPPGCQRPLSLAVHEAGACFVLYQNHAKIHHFSAQGIYQGAFGQNTTLATQNSSYFCGLALQALSAGPQVLLYDRQQLQAFVPDQDQATAHWSLPAANPEALPHCANGVSADAETVWLAHTAAHQAYTVPSHPRTLQPLSLSTTLRFPQDVAADRRGGVYIADTGQARVLHVNAQKKISTLLAHARFVAEEKPTQAQRKKVSP